MTDAGATESAPVEERWLELARGRVFTRSVGEGGVPLLCLHGGPGTPHDYLEPLEGLAAGRRVVFYDQLGCGRSDRPDDPALWTVDYFVDELGQVREALGLDRCHLFGNSWGGMLAMAAVLGGAAPVVSLILSSSPASIPRWIADCNRLRAELPDEVRATLDHHEASGFTACPEYQGAVAAFYRRHVCRLQPWPASFERSLAGTGLQVYETMNGPNEFTTTGRLRAFDVTDRLHEIRVPTLITGGRHDECRPEHLAAMQRLIPRAELVIFEASAHLAFVEEPERYLAVMEDFLGRVEAEPPLPG
ncbi:MAG TPA: proline iminopeptidase-family hydrolase [Candidatus Micrarchaeia archaeon]|nr:proline iminopeptidase-family hydrolase [Candidatus Micrarchaeia archaeon]